MVELKFTWKKETPLQHSLKTDAQPIHCKAERQVRHYKFLQKLDHIIKAEKESGSFGSIYSATDVDNIYLKKGINSFENKELIIGRNREGK